MDIAAHDPRCYQATGGIPDDLPPDLCDCKVWRTVDRSEREALAFLRGLVESGGTD